MTTQVFAIVKFPSDRTVCGAFSKRQEGEESALSFRARRISIERGNRPVGRTLGISIAVTEVKHLRDGGWRVRGHASHAKKGYEAEAAWISGRTPDCSMNRLLLIGYGH